jgi:transcriptional regulator with XRE-family HTH domain
LVRKSNETSPLVQERQRRGQTQDEAASALGIHRITLSRLENYRLTPGKALRRRIADYLGSDWTVGEVAKDFFDRYMERGRE